MGLSRFSALLMAVALGGAALSAQGQNAWDYRDSIFPDSGNLPAADNARFGQSVALDRNPDGSVRALYVGLPRATVTFGGVTNIEAGVVEVRGPGPGWPLLATLYPRPPRANAHFGYSLAVSNGVLVVGEPDSGFNVGGVIHHDAGRILIYRDANYGVSPQPQAQFDQSSPASVIDGAHEGWSVAVDGPGMQAPDGLVWVAWGAPNEGDNGCVRVTRHTVEGFGQTLITCATANANLGSSVAIRYIGDDDFRLVAGAPATTVAGSMLAGAAWIFAPPSSAAPNTLYLLQTLQANDPALIDAFGSSVALDRTRIFVGGTGRKKSGVGATGSISVFMDCGSAGFCLEAETFGQAAGELCGASLAADPRQSAAPIAAGCPRHADGVSGAGSVLRLERANTGWGYGWPATRIAMGALPHGADDLGRSVAMSGNLIFAGAPLNDVAGTNNGVVRVFARDRIFANGFD